MKKIILLLVTVFIVLSCKEDKKDNTPALAGLLYSTSSSTTSSSSLKFNVVSGTTNVACGTSFTVSKAVNGSTSKTLSIQDLRFYISGISLIKTDGTETALTLTTDGKWQYNNGALLDFEDKTGDCESAGTTDTNKSISFNTVAGTYKGVKFNFGLSSDLNKLSNTTSPAPFNINAMYWSWALGYKFSKIEFLTSTTNIKTSFHIGSLSCNGDISANTCSKPYLSTITLTKTNGNFDPLKDTITLDLNELLSNYDPEPTGSTAMTCMPIGNPAGVTKTGEVTNCTQILANVGLDATTGNASIIAQTAFSIK